MTKIPVPVQQVLDSAAVIYSESKATTNAGVFLRLLCRLIKPTTIIKMFAHKLAK